MMTVAIWPMLVLLSLLAVMLVGASGFLSYQRGWMKGIEEGARTLESSQLAEQASLINDLTLATQNLTAQLEKTETLRADAERRAAENHRAIQAAVNQSQSWSQFYTESTIAHGNAMAMAMEYMARLERDVSRLGGKIHRPQVLEDAESLYRERYLEPALQSVATGPDHTQDNQALSTVKENRVT